MYSGSFFVCLTGGGHHDLIRLAHKRGFAYSMEKLTEVLAMGGYAPYVWPSFILAAVLMIGMVVTSMCSLRRAQRTLVELQESASGNET